MSITIRFKIILITMFSRISLYSRRIDVFRIKKLMILIEITASIIKSTLLANHFSVKASSFWLSWMQMYSAAMRRESLLKTMIRFSFQLNAILRALLNTKLIRMFRIRSRFWNINFCSNVDTDDSLKITNFEELSETELN